MHLGAPLFSLWLHARCSLDLSNRMSSKHEAISTQQPARDPLNQLNRPPDQQDDHGATTSLHIAMTMTIAFILLCCWWSLPCTAVAILLALTVSRCHVLILILYCTQTLRDSGIAWSQIFAPPSPRSLLELGLCQVKGAAIQWIEGMPAPYSLYKWQNAS